MGEKKNKTSDTREHADFQDAYRRSSNFGGLADDESEKLKISGDGEVTLSESSDRDIDDETIDEILEDLSEEE